MDRKARLKMLIGGTDSELLYLDTRRQDLVPKQEEVKPSVSQPTLPAAPADNASSSDVEDEYLQSVMNVSLPDESRRSKRTLHKTSGNARPQYAKLSLKEMIQEDVEIGSFCPLLAVAKFPYKYVHTRTADKIAKSHFDQGKIWSRTWDLFYVHPPTSVSEKAIVFVPLRQVESFMDQINKTLSRKEKVSIPDDPDTGFVVHFEPDGSPQPKFLGVSRSQVDKENLVDGIYSPEHDPDSPPFGCPQDAFEAFTEKLERAFQAGRNKKKGKGGKGKGGKGEDQREKLKRWVDSLRRTQEYLGLRPSQPENLSYNEDASRSWEDQQKYEQDWGMAIGNILPPLDTSQPPQYPLAKLPVFICVDVESNEIQHSQITEIGVSTLDTADLVNLAPGDNGCNWISKIRTRHFRIAEAAHVVNSRYMSGCPDKFQFGESEIVPLSEMVGVVEACFRPPYSSTGNVQQGSELLDRNLVFVGHETLMDIEYLRSLGCTSIFAPQSDNNQKKGAELKLADTFIDQLDTNVFYRALTRDFNGTSLGNALLQVGGNGWFLHNAGNDAHYTMQTLIALALESRVQRPKQKAADDTSPDAPFYPLVCAAPSGADGNCLDEALVLANACEKAWADEVQRRISEARNEDAARRIATHCANWDAAVTESIYGGRTAGEKSRQRW
ncbi:hypothetical protein KEM56_000020 [Ascosphaera pollenicola]|nr:hypothetical protein KEM56_000020 [Ascosphaera pollenicola]